MHTIQQRTHTHTHIYIKTIAWLSAIGRGIGLGNRDEKELQKREGRGVV